MTAELASRAALWYNGYTKKEHRRFFRMDSIPQKQCTKCEQWKPATLEFFHVHSSGKYGLNSVCRQCKSLRTTSLPESLPEGFKRCYSCKEVKSISEFYKNRARRDGLHTACKVCAKVHDLGVNRRRSERHEASSERKCLRCEQVKPTTDFHKDSNGYYRNVCKECRNKERSLRVPSQIRIPEEKRCPWCKQVKPIKEFGLKSQRKDGHDTYCRDCNNIREQIKGTKQQRPPLSREEYNRKLQEQGGVCAICKTPPKRRRLHIDHNHQTGQIRDLLCHNCNLAFGMMREDPKHIKALLAYAEKWKGQT